VQAQFTDEGLQPPAEKTFVVLCGQKGMSEVRAQPPPIDFTVLLLVTTGSFQESLRAVCFEKTGCGGGHDRGGHLQGAVPHQLLNG